MKKKLFSLWLIVFSSNLFAEPIVNDATASANGFVITGENFGETNPMLFWDDLSDVGEDQISLDVKANSQTKWRQNGNAWGAPFKVEIATTRSGAKSKVYYGTGHKNFLGNPNHATPESTRNKLYVSWWYMPGKSPSDESGSNKFIRVWDNPNGYGTRISWTQMHLTCGTNNDSKNNVSWKEWNGYVNNWNHHEIYIDLEAGYIKAWLNGSLLHDVACAKHNTYAQVPLYVYLIGFDHGDNRYRGMTTAIEDIYIGSSLARVEISNSPKWTQTMIKEVLPIASWSNGKIVTLPLQGVIKTSGDIYVYVINERNEVNKAGFRAKCEECPKAPLQ